MTVPIFYTRDFYLADWQKKVCLRISKSGSFELTRNFWSWFMISKSAFKSVSEVNFRWFRSSRDTDEPIFQLLPWTSLVYRELQTSDRQNRFAWCLAKEFQDCILDCLEFVVSLFGHWANIFQNSVHRKQSEQDQKFSGAIFTLSLSVRILNSQCVEGTRDVRVL